MWEDWDISHEPPNRHEEARCSWYWNRGHRISEAIWGKDCITVSGHDTQCVREICIQLQMQRYDRQCNKVAWIFLIAGNMRIIVTKMLHATLSHTPLVAWCIIACRSVMKQGFVQFIMIYQYSLFHHSCWSRWHVSHRRRTSRFPRGLWIWAKTDIPTCCPVS